MTTPTHRIRLVLLIPPLLAWLAIGPVHALRQDTDEPIRVHAHSVETNEKTGVAIYSGDVLVEQGALSIRADRIEIRTRNKRTDFIRATGKPAKLRQRGDKQTDEIQAEADRIDYRVASGQIEMTGDVTVHRNTDVFTGDVLQYDLNDKTLKASGDEKGDGRIHAVIQPAKHNADSAPNP
ncbi:MAG TPA: lipopolysaccharide transport periplasmic protein LptA [Candidatus Methylomirabilis sp.]|nr:lipopolysaccharide transport periplasmic protein LptA [Candidatus Methylomirabilis sp.]